MKTYHVAFAANIYTSSPTEFGRLVMRLPDSHPITRRTLVAWEREATATWGASSCVLLSWQEIEHESEGE